MTTTHFEETMRGWMSFTERDFNQALREGRRRRRTCRLDLAIDVDMATIADAPPPWSPVTGTVRFPELGDAMAIDEGRWQMFVDAPDRVHKRMHYILRFRDAHGCPYVLRGFKVVENDPGYDSWTDTTTLFTRIFAGADERPDALVATGILFVRPLALLRQVASFRAKGGSWRERRWALPDFGAAFAGQCAAVYLRRSGTDSGPDSFHDPAIPGGWHEVPERPGLLREIVPYVTADGAHLNLHHLRREGDPPPARGPVMLAHGAGGRANVFYNVPLDTTIADALLDAGYDVWAQNWRGSIDFAPARWTLDQVAAYDHPAAWRAIAAATGATAWKAIVQCQGSTSLTMSAIDGRLPGLTHVLSSAVSLHPVVPWQATLKTRILLPALASKTPWIDPQWAIRAPTPLARAVAAVARYPRRRRCDDGVCQFSNYMYGSGPDMLWLHENLEEASHRFISREFGYAPISFFQQIRASIKSGHLVRHDPRVPAADLGDDFLRAPRTDARFTFACGDLNRLFLPGGQRRSFQHFDAYRPGHHAHLQWRRYSHIDPFLGRDAARDVFPTILAALDR